VRGWCYLGGTVTMHAEGPDADSSKTLAAILAEAE